MKKIYLILAGVFVIIFLPKITFAATLYFSPASGNYTVGSQFTVSVRTNTQGAAVNTAEANISFSSDTLEVVRVNQGSTFYLSAPGSPSSSSSTIYFGGGVPNPGYNGTAGVVGSITFRTKSAGVGTVSISSGKVLLNDGQGTNALSSSSSARFNITATPPPPPPSSMTTLLVSSTTHPNSQSWYNKDDLELSWTRPTSAYGFSFELDQKPDTIPDSVMDTTITTTKSYPDLKDGVWYFHIKARPQSSNTYGAVTHFKIQIDTLPPKLFDIKVVGTIDLNKVPNKPRLSFEAQDEGSGISHYDAFVSQRPLEENGNLAGLTRERVSSPLSFQDKLDAGPNIIRIVAVDMAGNARASELPIIVEDGEVVSFFKQELKFPIYGLILVNLGVVVLIALLFWRVIRRQHKKHSVPDQIALVQNEIDQSLEELKQEINQKLLKLATKANRDVLSEEEKAVHEVDLRINKTRKKIDKKVGSLRKTIKKNKTEIQ